ncbi:MAG: TetR/AcrR family transcriptional regulator [Simkaniaceae bacterium]|nr:TetR/AcrR family transcriptional regulator [Simkaniaceae bacterium]
MRKTQLKQTILNSARLIMEVKGEKAINIREIAKHSNCSLGSVYNVFENYDDIVLHLNAHTLEMLYSAIEESIDQKLKDGNLKEVFLEIGHAYLRFSQQHHHFWKALFEVATRDYLPDWYRSKVITGLKQIEDKIGQAFPKEKGRLHQILTFYWATIHGISSITLNRKLQVVEQTVDDSYINRYLTNTLDGLLK